MNKNTFRGFVACLVVTGPMGIVVSTLLPGWRGLINDLGVKGAWLLLVVSHLIYGLVIGVATILFFTVLEKFKYHGTVFVAGLSAAVTVTIANVATLWYSINFGGFSIFTLWLVWLTWAVNFVVFLSTRLLNPSSVAK